MIQFIIYSLTVIILGGCFTIAFPSIPCKTRLTYSYTNTYVQLQVSPKRITLVKQIWGIEIRAPPVNKGVSEDLI